MQQRARQERLNNSRKWKCLGHTKLLPMKDDGNYGPGSLDVLPSKTCAEGTPEIIGQDDDDDKEILSGDGEVENLHNSGEANAENCSCVTVESSAINKVDKYDSCDRDESLASIQNEHSDEDEDAAAEVKNHSKSKRHSEKDLDNPKPCKSRRAIDNSASLSRKYSNVSICSVEDCLPDGFYDAGRDRPFMPLRNYDQSFHLDSREVILVDRLFYTRILCSLVLVSGYRVAFLLAYWLPSKKD